jgi:hypothetical protein
MNIKEMVGGEKKVRFLYYRRGSLWYECENAFRFPVPITDCGEATFLAEDKAMLFMRYIRKELEEQKEPPMSELPVTL